MAKKYSKRKPSKRTTNPSDDATPVARDPAILRTPTITQNTPTDGTNDPVVPPQLSNELNSPSTPDRKKSSSSGNPAGNTVPNAPPKPTNPSTVPIDTSPDESPSVNTVDSNGETIDASRANHEPVVLDLADEMSVAVGDEKLNADASDDEEIRTETDDRSEVIHADIQWDDYTYESAAEEEKNDDSDNSPRVLPPPQDLFPHAQAQAVLPRQLVVMNEDDNFYYGSGHTDINPTTEDESIALQLQLDEYDENHEDDPQPPQTSASGFTAQTVYDSLESIRKDIILKMDLEGKTRDEEYIRVNNRFNAHQKIIDRLAITVDESKTLLETIVSNTSKETICVFCGGSHLIVMCPEANLFVTKKIDEAKLAMCLYCGKGGHLMIECVHAADFLDKISMRSRADEKVLEPDIEVDTTTPTDVYESLTEGQIDSLLFLIRTYGQAVRLHSFVMKPTFI
jgi:hypothetical protein